MRNYTNQMESLEVRMSKYPCDITGHKTQTHTYIWESNYLAKKTLRTSNEGGIHHSPTSN